jgi:hypothetical protein
MEPAFANAWPMHPLPSAPSAVYLLQDIHSHKEAQLNIKETLDQIKTKLNRDVKVGIEGAAGKFNFSPYQAFPDKNITESIAYQLLDENLIAGPILNGLLEKQIELIGIESPDLYIGNVEAYRSALNQKEQIQNKLAMMEKYLTQEKNQIYPRSLQKLDAQVSEYRKGKRTFKEFVNDLRSGADLRFSIEIYLSAQELENKLSFSEWSVNVNNSYWN